jgi:hypothetical protein
VFFNGSFYYQRAGTPKIAKYELSSQKYEEVVVDPNAAHKSDNVGLGRLDNYSGYGMCHSKTRALCKRCSGSAAMITG